MTTRRNPSSEEGEVEFLSRLREAGVTEAEFDYVGRRRRLRRVSFGETSPGDLKRMLEQVESQGAEKILEGLDEDTRRQVEKKMHDDVAYHSS